VFAYGANTVVHLSGGGDTTSLAIFARTNSLVTIAGDYITDSDVVDARNGATIRGSGNFESRADAAIFADQGGIVEHWGAARSKSINGFWQLAGNGCGLFNGAGTSGGTIRNYGPVSGIMPIITANGYTYQNGDVTVDNNGQALSYRLYTNEDRLRDGAVYPARFKCLVQRGYFRDRNRHR